MDSMSRFFKRLAILLRGEHFKDELDEEMAFHREQRERELREGGMSAEAARHAAMRQFGNAARLKDQSHAVVGFRLESVAQDLRFAARQLRKNPGFTFTAVLVLALGICASVAIFAFVDAALIKPLPYQNANRLVAVYENTGLFPHSNLSYLDFRDWRASNKSFVSLDAWNSFSYILGTPAGPQMIRAGRVSDGFFRTLGVRPMIGRDFYAGEDKPEAARAVLLNYGTWQQRFGGNPSVLGQAVTLNGESYNVIGVLPKDFHFAPRGMAEFWTALKGTGGCEIRRGCHNLYGVARLKDGASVAAALADTQAIAQTLEKQYPDSNRGQSAAVVPLSEAIVGDIRPILLVLLAGAGLLLIIACVNVSSLLLVRSESRRREIAVRSALGASRARLVHQFVTEGLVLVVASAALGVFTAYGSMGLLIRLIPAEMMANMPYLNGLGLNVRVAIFAFAIALMAAVLFSVAPMTRMSVRETQEGLREGGRTAAGTVWRRFGSNLVVLELCIAVVLLVGAGLLGKSFYRLLHVDLGLEPDHLAMMDVVAPVSPYKKDEQVAALARTIEARLAILPGVESVGITNVLPVDHNGNTTWFRVVGKPYDGRHQEANERDVSSSYFSTLQVKLLRGRFFSDTDDGTKPRVVIINQALAKKYFPGEDPVGQRIGNPDLNPKSIAEVIGVVDDFREGALDEEIWPATYQPYEQSPDNYFSLVVRNSRAEQTLLPEMADAIHQIDPGIAAIHPTTMMTNIHDSPVAYLHRSSAVLVGGFAGLALLLGVVGLYGVIAYSVSQRTREIGVRMALGAQRGSVYGLVLKEAGWLTAFGIVLGLICSLGAATLMSKLLFGTRSWDVPTLASVAVLLGLSALLASFFPARRAASVNPVEALRAE